jgi:single-stranded-DNA-specific exonuclease
VAGIRRELNVQLDVRRWADLVAIGTIADVAPLDGDNRALVRAGLHALAQAERPGVRALLELLGISCAGPLTSRDVAFRIAPQLNAPGRLGSPMLALELLLAKDIDVARGLAAELAQVTATRREQQERISDEALAEIEAAGYATEPAIVLGRQGWNPGVVGIVAGRLVERFARPVVMIGFEGEVGRGSVRGPAGSRLYDALAATASTLVRFGGHQAAAGLELRFDNLAAFRQAFCASVVAQPQTQLPATQGMGLELMHGDSPDRVMDDFDRLEPCGPDNPRPQLLVRGQVLEARSVGAGHLRLKLALPSGSLDCFGVNFGSHAKQLAGTIAVSGDLRRNTFRGVTTVELFVATLLDQSGIELPPSSASQEVRRESSP